MDDEHDFDAWEADLLVSDDELTELALAADPDVVLDDDAVPFGGSPSGLLPDWYMPLPQASSNSPRKRAVVAVVVSSLLVLNALGLCVTYGSVVVAW
jgi:hypothetical protein